MTAYYESACGTTASQRKIAEQIDIPRSTLQYWIERKNSIDAEPAVKDFFESPSGTAFLHRLVVAAHCTMTLLGSGSVRHVCRFLELTGLVRASELALNFVWNRWIVHYVARNVRCWIDL
jgi:hypothetical protein